MARGSVFRRNGGYGIRVDLGPDPATGKRRQRMKQGFSTKREAEAALAELMSDVQAGTTVAASADDVGSFLDEWLEGQRSRLKETTWESYRVVVVRVKTHIGRVNLQAVTPLELERFYRTLGESGGHRGQGLSPKTVKNTHTVLRKAFSDAERLGLVARNPAAAARPPSVQRTERKTWSSDELKAFLGIVRDDRLFGLYVLLATTGMRRGEALGLRWGDADLDSGELHIVQTLTSINYQPVISTPKTKRSRRLIYLDDDTIEVLRKHRVRQKEERLRAGEGWVGDQFDLVFRDEFGAPLNPDWVTSDFRNKVRANDVPTIRLHDLRHTYATLALKGGVHPKVVSDRLGHASVGVTLDLYSHVTPAIGRDAANVVASSIFG